MLGPGVAKARYIDFGDYEVARSPKPIPALKTRRRQKNRVDLNGRIPEQKGQMVRSVCQRSRERPAA